MIDGIVSGRLQLKPKMLTTKRGPDYLIAKLTVYGYRSGNLPAIELNADLIAFDRRLCSRLMECDAGQIVSIAGIIRPAEQVEMGGQEIVLKITAKAMVDGYLYRQSWSKGRLFDLIG